MGSLSLIGAIGCSYKAGSIVYHAAKKESEISKQLWRDGVGAFVDEAHSRFSRVSKELFRALSWAVPAFCFAAVTAAALSPERNYLGSKTISDWSCLTCESPKRPNGSPDDSYSLKEEIQKVAAELFPKVIDKPPPRPQEDPLGYVTYVFFNVLERVHLGLEKLVPPLMLYGLFQASKVRERSPLSTEGEKGLITELAQDVIDEIKAEGDRVRSYVYSATQSVQQQVYNMEQRQLAQQVPIPPGYGNAEAYYSETPPLYQTPSQGGQATIVVNVQSTSGDGNVVKTLTFEEVGTTS